MNDRAYRDDHLGAGVFDDGEPLPGDPACPTCRRVTSVQRVGAMWWCTDCNLVFDAGDHERVSPDWVQTYRDLRAEQSTPRTRPGDKSKSPPAEARIHIENGSTPNGGRAVHNQQGA